MIPPQTPPPITAGLCSELEVILNERERRIAELEAELTWVQAHAGPIGPRPQQEMVTIRQEATLAGGIACSASYVWDG